MIGDRSGFDHIPPADDNPGPFQVGNLKAFLIICKCKGPTGTGADHDEDNKACPVEQMMHILLAHNKAHIVHDIIDCSPIAQHDQGDDEVKHEEVTE